MYLVERKNNFQINVIVIITFITNIFLYIYIYIIKPFRYTKCVLHLKRIRR